LCWVVGLQNSTTVLNFKFGSHITVLNFGLGSQTTEFNFGFGNQTTVLNFGLGSRTIILEKECKCDSLSLTVRIARFEM